MSTSRVRRHAHLVVGVFLGASFLSTGGAGASELDPLQDVVESADTVADTTTQVTETVTEGTQTVSGTVNETTEATVGTIEQTTEAIVEPTAQTVDEASGAGSHGKTASAARGAPPGDEIVGSSRTSGPREEIEHAGTRDRGAADRSDPCAHGISPACLLDVLYGVGDSAPEVLGTFLRNLANTGLGLTALVLGALLALAGGAGALRWNARLDRGRATPA